MSTPSDREMIEKSLSGIFDIPGSLPQDLAQNPQLVKFFEGVNYSLFSGGKRFRPNLVLSVADAHQKNKSDFLPFANAVELIHTYSLIHDDLPSMDNDKERRGKPTNHIVYGESSAVLAGDALLTEAFFVLGRAYSDRASLGLDLVLLLGEAAGVRGMLGGQVLDMMTPQFSKAEEIFVLHEMKTGALIRVAIEGAARIALDQEESKKKDETQNLWKEFGRLLGLSFQIADDVLDFDQQAQDHRNLASITTVEKTQQQLQQISDKALEILQKLSSLQNLKIQALIDLVEFNRNRKS